MQIQSSAEVYLPSSYKKKRDVQNCNQNEGKLVQACKNFSLSSCNEKGINYFINNYTDESVSISWVLLTTLKILKHFEIKDAIIKTIKRVHIQWIESN